MNAYPENECERNAETRAVVDEVLKPMLKLINNKNEILLIFAQIS